VIVQYFPGWVVTSLAFISSSMLCGYCVHTFFYLLLSYLLLHSPSHISLSRPAGGAAYGYGGSRRDVRPPAALGACAAIARARGPGAATSHQRGARGPSAAPCEGCGHHRRMATSSRCGRAAAGGRPPARLRGHWRADPDTGRNHNEERCGWSFF
jgi:hypothetical protein